MARLATPGVYVKENNAFSSSVVSAPTAIPAFIGHTAKAQRGHESLQHTPTRVDSFKEYINYFGRGPKISFAVRAKDGTDFSLKLNADSNYNLYNALRLFYSNGGGPCYIVSVGDYETSIKLKFFSEGLETLIGEQEPSMIVCPDAVNLETQECFELYREILRHCGRDTRDRFAILDIPRGNESRTYDAKDVINQFRDGIGHNNLAYGAAYYPWLNTTIVTSSEISFKNISNPNELIKLLTREAENRFLGGPPAPPPKAPPSVKGAAKPAPKATTTTVVDSRSKQKFDEVKGEIERLRSANGSSTVIDQNLKAISPLYNALLRALREQVNIMPTCGAIAGIYANVDNNVGVHKAPANIGLNSVISPCINVTGPMQEDLNLPVNGKAVNAIRSFIGKGVLVWGARTLDGNSQDWKYVNVRRTLLMIEQSVKSAVENYVFEPNTPQTWLKVRIAIENFLTTMWKKGALLGLSPAQAYEVIIGLGETMTPEDVLDGIMRISVFLSIARPAEFIEITFEQRMMEDVEEGGEEEGEEDDEGDDGDDGGGDE